MRSDSSSVLHHFNIVRCVYLQQIPRTLFWVGFLLLHIRCIAFCSFMRAHSVPIVSGIWPEPVQHELRHKWPNQHTSTPFTIVGARVKTAKAKRWAHSIHAPNAGNEYPWNQRHSDYPYSVRGCVYVCAFVHFAALNGHCDKKTALFRFRSSSLAFHMHTSALFVFIVGLLLLFFVFSSPPPSPPPLPGPAIGKLFSSTGNGCAWAHMCARSVSNVAKDKAKNMFEN